MGEVQGQGYIGQALGVAEVLAGIPMGREGTAQDVAGCCLFPASDLSAYVTGSEVDVNGGSLIH